MEKHLSEMTLEELIAPGGHECSCGKRHECGIKILKVGKGALLALPEALATLNVHRPFVVMDMNTKKAAGDQLEALLRAVGIDACYFTFHTAKRLEPDESSVGALTLAFDPACDCILAVGSGVINDCCKVIAHAMSLPYLVVCTAPSMDGYASNCSAMIQNHVKVSPVNACAQAIIADTDILKNAPELMLKAGLGDMLAKYISLCEWHIAHLVHGDMYCEEIVGLVRASLRKIRANADRLLDRDEAAVTAIAEGLILSGIAMAFAGNSRPASGLEHYFSHLWEMRALEQGKGSELHGIQVGIGTLITLWIYENILEGYSLDMEKAKAAFARFSPREWELQCKELFGGVAPEILTLETKTGKNDAAAFSKRLQLIEKNWSHIQEIMQTELPKRSEVLQIMQNCQMPLLPQDIGLTAKDARAAFLGSRDIRDKYLTSSLLWDIGLYQATATRLEAAVADGMK